MPNKNVKNLSDEQYAQLGKAVEQIIRKDYVDLALNKKRLITTNLIKGVVTGFGGVLGATILVAILLGILSLFGDLPWVGDFFKSTRDTIRR